MMRLLAISTSLRYDLRAVIRFQKSVANFIFYLYIYPLRSEHKYDTMRQFICYFHSDMIARTRIVVAIGYSILLKFKL